MQIFCRSNVYLPQILLQHLQQTFQLVDFRGESWRRFFTVKSRKQEQALTDFTVFTRGIRHTKWLCVSMHSRTLGILKTNKKCVEHTRRVTRTDLTHDKLLSSCHMVSLSFCSLYVPWITMALDNFVNVSDKKEPAPRFSCSYDPFVFTFHNHENFVLWRLETASKYDCFYIFPGFVTEEACTCGVFTYPV